MLTLFLKKGLLTGIIHDMIKNNLRKKVENKAIKKRVHLGYIVCYFITLFLVTNNRFTNIWVSCY